MGDISKSESAAPRTPSTQMVGTWPSPSAVAGHVRVPAVRTGAAQSARNTNPRFGRIQGVSQ